MRVLLYELLTQTILLLAWLRARLVRYAPMRRAPGRVFDVYADERWSCCDCGLEHDQQIAGPGFECEHEVLPGPVARVGHSFPMRLDGYGYKLRAMADEPSLAKKS